MDELKKCPFCGGEAETRDLKDFDGKVIMASVVCKQCEAKTKQYGTIDAAIKAWNNRV